MTQFVNNNVSPGDIVSASDHNTQGANIASVVNGNIDNDNIKSNAAIVGTKLADASLPSVKLDGINAPQGFLLNGRISTSVASNNLTVAIKGLDGNDPSASNPVYCRIGNTVRSITSALSVTKNAGTNWFNSGSSELATFEVDYFVYLGYNATDGVVIGFARIPYARIYGDFSTTTTNEKYCAISTITNAASTDEYEVVGRFNATLSATASFNWSIPGTSIIINRPIFETRELTYTPTLGNGTLGNGTLAGTYQIQNTFAIVRNTFTLGTTSAVSSQLNFKTPITTVSAGPVGTSYYTDTGVASYNGQAILNSSTAVLPTVSGTASTYANSNALNSTVPFTWGSTDIIRAYYHIYWA